MNLNKRLLTAFLLYTLTITIIYLGGIFIGLAIAGLCLVCFNEILNIKKINHHIFPKIIAYGLLLAILTTTFNTKLTLSIWSSPYIFLPTVLLLVLSLLELIRKKPLTFHSIFGTYSYTLFHLSLTIPVATLIRNQESGFIDALWIIAIVSTVDSCAYFSGKLIGKRKLSTISPNKTIEGSICGITAGIITGTSLIFLIGLPPFIYIPICLFISFTSPLGDLHESLIKRHFNVKDSSSILPGHGGIYDRLDGYIFTLPLFFYIKLFLEYLF
ncbi:hypothetical protein DID78_00760 [Candidatus Marinamargulisbacteria bacterium SCGC AG-343-D04]|nr:hypothetical protein DID78_00760 [Candidatus Marinamargulisbacteria bacterium SCGC AG-343-D04]